MKQNAESHHDSTTWAHFCECEMRGSPRAYSAQLRSTRTNDELIVTVGASKHEMFYCESRKSPIRMRNASSQRPHPALLVSPSTKQGSNCPAILLIAGVSRLATRSCPFEVRIWRNAQCSAVSRPMIFGSLRHARNNHRPGL